MPKYITDKVYYTEKSFDVSRQNSYSPTKNSLIMTCSLDQRLNPESMILAFISKTVLFVLFCLASIFV